jgi:PTS system nitrogen regulatory IIA component
MSIEELIKYMGPDLFVPTLRARTKDEALEELTAAVVRGSNIKERDLVLEMLRNREQLGSTALESGVAFPHGRSLAVQRLTILVARSSDGVDFDGDDGKPTHLFFLLLAPPHDTGNLYLQALGKIAELVRKEDVRQRLMTVTDFDTLVAALQESSP